MRSLLLVESNQINVGEGDSLLFPFCGNVIGPSKSVDMLEHTVSNGMIACLINVWVFKLDTGFIVHLPLTTLVITICSMALSPIHQLQSI
jgi:hypothetical protein